MHGERDGRRLSSSPPSMLTDETTKHDHNSTASSSHNSSTELAYLPIGCSVSAKYRGAFCSAQVKAIGKQVKLKVTLLDSNETITISEEQLVHSVPLRIGNTVTVRLTSSNRRQSNDSNSHQHYSRSGLAAFINQTNPDEKQATIKQIIDNSIYTVVFDDGDEKSLRRSSLCLQGVRLYQTQYGQQKILEEMPTSPPPSLPTTSETTSTNANDASSIVAIQRKGSSNQEVFPAYVLKRKALPDYMWVRSFIDGREYIVHARDDVQTYQNNSEIQALCRSTSKQATQACEKFIKYNQIPAVWQKKKNKSSKSDDRNAGSDVENSSSNESSSDESDDEDEDEIDEETTEEKDSFVAQLFAFMDDRGTPINNIPKVQNYDLDLHRLFKIVRMFGGYNKVTKNDQWDQVHIKMGLPDDTSSENGRSVESAYKKYLFAYEDLSKKLGSMNAPSAYFGGRTSLGSDSRRSLIRVRQQQQEEEKAQKKVTKSKQSPASVKQRSRKSNESRPSTDSKQTSSTKKSTPKSSSAPPNRKGPNRSKSSNVISSSSSESENESESESSDNQSSRSSSSNYKKNKTKVSASSSTSTTPKKPSIFPSTISKKTTQPTASSSTSSTTTKTDVKKISTNTKPISSSTDDSKQSKLTITIPISKSKNQSTNASNIPTMKKTNLPSSTKEEKKKVLETKSTPIKTESKPLASSMTKKPVISSSKIPQISKTNQQQKQSNTETVKSASSTVNKTSTTSTGPFKPKASQSQTSTMSNQKDRTTTPKPSSSTESRPMKSTKINTPATKSLANTAPIKKTKPTMNEENLTKPVPATSTMKIPKLSANADAMKKSTMALEKIPKKQTTKDETTKIPKISDTSTTSKSTTDQQTKSHTSSPISETNKRPVLRDASPLPVTPTSLSPARPIPSESNTSTHSPLASIHPQRLSRSEENAPDVKSSEPTSSLHSISTISKGSTETELVSSNHNKRSHLDEPSESIYTSEVDEQLSPSKRARRSISSQESFETFSSDPSSVIDNISTHRNTQLTYEDISINDILLVTWGNHGTKQYPARCIEKNDEKKELFVHYTGWNSRHDAWIKLDRVIERKDTNNANTLFQQQRPRRTSQINTSRQHHLDSTNSNEQSHQQHVTTGDTHPTPTLADDDELNKSSKSISNERNKIDESDTDENSQGQNEIWNNVEPISSAEDETLSSSSTHRPNQSTSGTDTPSTPVRRRISTNVNEPIRNEFEAIEENENENGTIREIEQIIPKRRQSRATSSNNKVDLSSSMKTEQTEETPLTAIDILEHPHQYPLHVKEETIDSSTPHSSFQAPFLPPPVSSSSSSSLLNDRLTITGNLLTSPPIGNRRASVRQKRRSLREPNNAKDPSGSAKKKPKLDNGNLILTDNGTDNITNTDLISTRSNSTDQQTMENMTIKRARPAGRRGGKRSANQQEHENEDYRSNSPSNMTMRQQLKDMFKHRPSRYNFLDLNNNLSGDERITHLKDRMRECQKAFFNLRSALVKIEKQRKGFLRKQKPGLTTASPIIQATSTEILATPTCT